jgi:hypothetical protein
MFVTIRMNTGFASDLTWSRHLKQSPDSEGELLPVGRFRVEPATSGCREPVNARLSVVLGCLHLRSQHSCGLESVKGWIQGALTNAESVSGYLPNPLLYAPPVIWPKMESLQDQQVKRALEVFSLRHAAPLV